MKRFIAKILSAIMLISLIPTVAFAENSENILYEEHFESETIKDEIEKNNTAGVGMRQAMHPTKLHFR